MNKALSISCIVWFLIWILAMIIAGNNGDFLRLHGECKDGISSSNAVCNIVVFVSFMFALAVVNIPVFIVLWIMKWRNSRNNM